jgi:hypothetical protein
MVDISRHPILEQAIQVCWAIEKCGASPELTSAVTLASALLKSIDELLDAHAIAIKKDPSGGHPSHDWYHDGKFGGQLCRNCGRVAGSNRAQSECMPKGED